LLPQILSSSGPEGSSVSAMRFLYNLNRRPSPGADTRFVAATSLWFHFLVTLAFNWRRLFLLLHKIFIALSIVKAIVRIEIRIDCKSLS
jgi:hypothetical protein